MGLFLGSGAIVLGPIDVGPGAKVGAGAVVVRPVPPGATVVGVPGRIAGPDQFGETAPFSERMPDPMLRVVSLLLDRLNRLEDRLRGIEEMLPVIGTDGITSEYRCEDQIWEVLKEVIDPEVGIDIVDLGLIKEIVVRGDRAEINMILTSTACPLVNHLTEQVKRKVLGICGIDQVEVRVLDEPWNWNRFVQQKGDLKEV